MMRTRAWSVAPCKIDSKFNNTGASQCMCAAEQIPGTNPSPITKPPLSGGDENAHASIPGALFYHDNGHGVDTHCTASVVESGSSMPATTWPPHTSVPCQP